MSRDRDRFLELVLRNPVNRVLLERGSCLGVADWWLTAGAVFQTVWNCLDGRDPGAGISDYDLFYFDAADRTWEGEDAVISRAAMVFSDVNARVEIRNEARVHVWYEEHFGVPARPFASSRDAIDHFASTTCCYAVSRNAAGQFEVGLCPARLHRPVRPTGPTQPSPGTTRGLREEDRTLAPRVDGAHRGSLAGVAMRAQIRYWAGIR